MEVVMRNGTMIYRVAPHVGTDHAAFRRHFREQVLPAVERGFGRAGGVTGTTLHEKVQGDGDPRSLWAIEFTTVTDAGWVPTRIADALQKLHAFADAELLGVTFPAEAEPDEVPDEGEAAAAV
jgi:hypothetical protein